MASKPSCVDKNATSSGQSWNIFSVSTAGHTVLRHMARSARQNPSGGVHLLPSSFRDAASSVSMVARRQEATDALCETNALHPDALCHRPSEPAALLWIESSTAPGDASAKRFALAQRSRNGTSWVSGTRMWGAMPFRSSFRAMALAQRRAHCHSRCLRSGEHFPGVSHPWPLSIITVGRISFFLAKLATRIPGNP